MQGTLLCLQKTVAFRDLICCIVLGDIHSFYWDGGCKPEMVNCPLMDPCIMASSCGCILWTSMTAGMGSWKPLGLGNRVEPVSCFHLQGKKHKVKLYKCTNNGSYSFKCNYESLFSGTDSDGDQSFTFEITIERREMTAYYSMRGNLGSLLKEHKNAKFMVLGIALVVPCPVLFPTVLGEHEEEI
ncbi:hypothetical protein RJT34_20482 [Clitoria ternatea]|uniref:Uncharacterized protein n=1 Tax=Clitoria ternatea TaxID=43366 RepID=A0AAN9IT64_CLITE